MARQARAESETGYYHIMTRGINKEKIYESDQEKENLLQYIKEKAQEIACVIVAYCIMDNHMHMIIQAEKHSLISMMRKVNISYAMYYNQRHKRIGPVVQDRYKSENITDEKYLLGAIRYIHNNPVKANVVERAEDYKWSSIREYQTDEIILVNRQAKEEIMGGFISKSDFKEFHQIEDDISYLEIKEEAKENKEKRAEKIMESYFEENGITDISNFIKKDELIMKLIMEGISYRQIADLLSVNLNTIHKVNKKYRP
ncbi:MAG: hypothetical protein GX285_03570 [Clostridiales bacterium]|nr:hypothetical protein [Clostridiales bacterium]